MTIDIDYIKILLTDFQECERAYIENEERWNDGN